MGNLLIHLVFVIDATLWTPDEISLAHYRLQNAAQYWQSQGIDVQIEPSTLWEMRFIPQSEQARGEELWSLLELTTAKRGTFYVTRDGFWMNALGYAACGHAAQAVYTEGGLDRIAAHEIGHILCLEHSDTGIMRARQ